ncbi:MAG: glycosyltransferase family 39 protein [Opitutales bacterium]|nr:glycosyltransferase family 39 protein [Opitutales bacterium]
MPSVPSLPRRKLHISNIPFAVALLALIASFFISRYYYAGTHPLVVNVSDVTDAVLVAALDDGWEAPLVRVDEGVFATELPPRASYTLSLRGEGGECTLGSVRILDLSKRPVDDILNWQADGAKTLTKGETIGICEELPPSPRNAFVKTFFTLLCIFWLFAYGLLAIVRKPDGLTLDKGRGPGLLWGWFLLLGALHMWLILGATPLFWAADSIGYAGKALSLYNGQGYYTGGYIDQLSRAPGCSYLEALAWSIFGFSARSVVLMQGLLYCAAVLFALHTVTRLIGRGGAGALAAFLFFSPPATMANRLLASESLFTSLSIVAAVCMLRAMLSQKRRWAWSTATTLALCPAILTRPNGVVLLAFPIFMLACAAWSSIRERSTAPAKRSLHWILPPAFAALTIVLWSWSNHKAVGYFSPTDIVGLSKAEAGFKSGVMDLRAATAQDEALYETVIRARYNSGYTLEAWSLRNLFREGILDGKPDAWGNGRRMDERMGQFARMGTAELGCIQMAARTTRAANWGLFMMQDSNFQPYGLPKYNFEVYPEKDWAYINEIIAGWVHTELQIEQKPVGPLQRAYNAILPLYKPAYALLVGAALLAYAFSAVRGSRLALVLLLPFFGNLLFNASLGVVIARYVNALEPLLWLGTSLVLGGLAREAWKGTRSSGTQVESQSETA